MQSIQELGELEAAIAIAAIREELIRRSKTAVIAVADAHGELVSLLRMNGAPLSSVEVATRKCWTAARERISTGELGKMFQKNGWQMLNSDPRFTGWDGGVPVRSKNAVVGSVAVSGLDQAEDAELARLGAARIEEAIAK